MWLSLPGTVSRGSRAPTGIVAKARLFGVRVRVQRGVVLNRRQQSVVARVLHERVALLFALLFVPVCCQNTTTQNHTVAGNQVAGSVPHVSSALRGGVFGRAHGRRSLVADECGWERHDGYFMSDFAKHPGQVHHAVFNNLAEAKAD